MIIGVTTKFDAAHFLPEHKGKCKNLHGHTWHLNIEVCGELNNQLMVVDLKELKQMVEDVIGILDHSIINNVLPMKTPTCERMVEWIADEISIHPLMKINPIELYKIELQEGDGGYAKWQKTS